MDEVPRHCCSFMQQLKFWKIEWIMKSSKRKISVAYRDVVYRDVRVWCNGAWCFSVLNWKFKTYRIIIARQFKHLDCSTAVLSCRVRAWVFVCINSLSVAAKKFACSINSTADKTKCYIATTVNLFYSGRMWSPFNVNYRMLALRWSVVCCRWCRRGGAGANLNQPEAEYANGGNSRKVAN